MLKRLLRWPGAQALLASLLGRYLEFALRTTRWTLDGEAHMAGFLAGGCGVVAFWHERLPLMPALWALARQRAMPRAAILVSRHSDGRVLGEMMRRFGVEVVHGSSARDGRERGGVSGVLALLDVLQEGGLAALTPDGPRGPRRQAAPGVAQLAGRSGRPVLPCAAQMRPHRVLGTWDRLVLPVPWGRGVLVCGPLIEVPREDWQGAIPRIEAALTEAAERADRLCR